MNEWAVWLDGIGREEEATFVGKESSKVLP
jgi:hypothetical protein